jgi:hypothetical protein
MSVRLAVGIGRMEKNNQPLDKITFGKPLQLIGCE